MEHWKFVQKTTGKKAVEYWISDQGRLKSVYSKSGKFVIKLGSKHKLGYRHTAIGWIHRLVAKAFVPNPQNLPEIDHIDGNPSNNVASNLKWCTHRQNIRNPVTLARMRKFKNEKTISRVRQYSEDGELVKEWRSAREIAIALGVSKERVAYILKRTNQTWRGFRWERVKLTVPRYKDFS